VFSLRDAHSEERAGDQVDIAVELGVAAAVFKLPEKKSRTVGMPSRRFAQNTANRDSIHPGRKIAGHDGLRGTNLR
jgi:hypothetical protein